MRKIALLLLTLPLAGCGLGGEDPAVAPEANPRARCDSFAARAIQSEALSVATSLAAQAAECYADLQNR